MGQPFHVDIHLPPGSVLPTSGSFSLFDPGGVPVVITHVRFSTDTGQRFVIGLDDADGERILSGWIGANGGAMADMHLDTGTVGMVGPIVVITSAASGFDAAIEGCYLL